ncbi:hypothetical protein KCU65_g55, partial [Aureobasidium melanogenum]
MPALRHLTLLPGSWPLRVATILPVVASMPRINPSSLLTQIPVPSGRHASAAGTMDASEASPSSEGTIKRTISSFMWGIALVATAIRVLLADEARFAVNAVVKEMSRIPARDDKDGRAIVRVFDEKKGFRVSWKRDRCNRRRQFRRYSTRDLELVEVHFAIPACCREPGHILEFMD